MKLIDYIALVLLAGQYFIYQYFYSYYSNNEFGKTRESIITRYRWNWLNIILESENPILGIQTIRNLEMVHTFLITLTMIMMGGVTSVFSANMNWVHELSDGSFTDFMGRHIIAVKLLVVAGFLMVALFHFIFGLRICFNLNFTVAGSTKSCSLKMKQFIHNQVQRQARHFISGVRALYFALFPMIWILNVWAMLFLSFLITILFYRFDYLSVPDLGIADLEREPPVRRKSGNRQL